MGFRDGPRQIVGTPGRSRTFTKAPAPCRADETRARAVTQEYVARAPKEGGTGHDQPDQNE